MAELAVAALPTFNSPVWHLQKPDGPSGIIMVYYRLNQVVVPIVAVVPKMVSFLEQISVVSNTLYSVLDLKQQYRLMILPQGHVLSLPLII